jgi:hypothetical protein
MRYLVFADAPKARGSARSHLWRDGLRRFF